MSGKHRSTPALQVETPFNPRTGKVWRLGDAELRPQMAAVRSKLDDPAEARKLLQRVGIMTPGGKLTKRFGG